MEVPFIDIHTHVTPSNMLCYGIHPWWFDDGSFDFRQELLQLEKQLVEERLAAIGETGIDKLHQQTVPLQIDSFEKHIALSETYRKPLVIHNVKGNEILLRLHKKHHPKQAWIVHGFNGNAIEAQQLTTHGLFLSIGESILYENRKITESIKSIPLDCLFFETDISGNSIVEIYQKAASRLNLPLELLKERIFANFVRLNLGTWKTGTNGPGCSLETLALRNCERVMS